jgi:hypothetical protein
LLAAKTEFRTIASKIIQHPAVTIERIKLRRRFITLSANTTNWAGPPPWLQRRTLIVRRAVDETSATLRDYLEDRMSSGTGN